MFYYGSLKRVWDLKWAVAGSGSVSWWSGSRAVQHFKAYMHFKSCKLCSFTILYYNSIKTWNNMFYSTFSQAISLCIRALTTLCGRYDFPLIWAQWECSTPRPMPVCPAKSPHSKPHWQTWESNCLNEQFPVFLTHEYISYDAGFSCHTPENLRGDGNVDTLIYRQYLVTLVLMQCLMQWPITNV